MTKLIDLIDNIELKLGMYGYGSAPYKEARTAVLEAVEKLERDAARWNAVMQFSSDQTLRLHYTHPDHRTAMVDLVMEATNGQGN